MFAQAHLDAHLGDAFGTAHISCFGITKQGIKHIAGHGTMTQAVAIQLIQRCFLSLQLSSYLPQNAFSFSTFKEIFFLRCQTPGSDCCLRDPYLGLQCTASGLRLALRAVTAVGFCVVFSAEGAFLSRFPVVAPRWAFVQPLGTALFICTNSTGGAPRGLFVQRPVEPPSFYC